MPFAAMAQAYSTTNPRSYGIPVFVGHGVYVGARGSGACVAIVVVGIGAGSVG